MPENVKGNIALKPIAYTQGWIVSKWLTMLTMVYL